VFEKNSVTDPSCSCSCYVNSKTTMVFHRCAQVETWLGSCVPRVTVVGFDVGLDRASNGGETAFACSRACRGREQMLICWAQSRDWRRRFNVSSVGSMRWHQSEKGNLSSTPASIEDEMGLKGLYGPRGLVSSVLSRGRTDSFCDGEVDGAG
jgi:hypothetical protein